MRLLYVDKALAIHGGVERVLTDKLNWLVEFGGCEICLLIAYQGKHPIVFPLNPKVMYYDLDVMFHQIFHYPLWKRYFRLSQLRRLFRQRIAAKIREFAPDVIVCTRLEYISDVMKVRGTIPVVYESHDSFISYKFGGFSLLQKLQVINWHRAVKKIQMIISLSQGDASEWKEINPHVQVIPNVVHLNDTGRYSDCCSKSAIFVGRYSFQKDIQSLIRVWKLVSKRYPDWQLHIFGGYGDQEDKLLSIINQLGINNIVIHQPTISIFEEYIKCSMLLMTSRYEPFGLVLPEAMSCGLPVVAFDCPYGPADIISDGVDGFLVRDRNINEYADKVCSLIEDAGMRRQMGQAGIQSSKRYSVEKIMPLWSDLFERISIKS